MVAAACGNVSFLKCENSLSGVKDLNGMLDMPLGIRFSFFCIGESKMSIGWVIGNRYFLICIPIYSRILSIIIIIAPPVCHKGNVRIRHSPFGTINMCVCSITINSVCLPGIYNNNSCSISRTAAVRRETKIRFINAFFPPNKLLFIIIYWMANSFRRNLSVREPRTIFSSQCLCASALAIRVLYASSGVGAHSERNREEANEDK